jgi:hypothetical protein
MFFKKGLRDPSLIRKLTMKNSRTLEAIIGAHKTMIFMHQHVE